MASWSNCHYYPNALPDVGQVVITLVKETTGLGVSVHLLEFNNIRGFLSLSGLSEVPRIGKHEVLVVTSVDRDGVPGQIQLSQTGITSAITAQCRKRYLNAKATHAVLRLVSEKLKIPVLQLYTIIAWPLSKTHESTLEAFSMSITKPDVLNTVRFPTAQLKTELRLAIASRVPSNALHLRADLAVKCSTPTGASAVSAALRRSERAAGVRVRVGVPPVYYVYLLECFNEREGVSVMRKALDVVRRSVQAEWGGWCEVVVPPRVVGREDTGLGAMLERWRGGRGSEVVGSDDDALGDLLSDEE